MRIRLSIAYALMLWAALGLCAATGAWAASASDPMFPEVTDDADYTDYTAADPILDTQRDRGFLLDKAAAGDHSCSTAELSVFTQPMAEILKLRPSAGACSHAVVEIPLMDTGEACVDTEEFEDFSLEEVDDPGVGDEEFVLVSLNLGEYRLSEKAQEMVEKNIELFSGRIRDRFTVFLGRSTRFLDMMKGILRDEGVPEEMAYLPLIESGYSTKARSRARAVGPWQFMKGTGKHYGLKIDQWVDERRDPVKSTRAAARYLKELYRMFGAWSLAMASYNAGEGKISRALRKNNSDDYWSLLGTRHIKRETKFYVPKFIAARLIADDPARYNITDISYEPAFEYDEVEVSFPVTMDVAAQCSGATPEELLDLNPELMRWTTPPVETYMLRVPRGTAGAFIENLAKVPRSQRVSVTEHVIRRGDTLSVIARKYGVPVEVIMSYNKLRSVKTLRPGQSLIIPLSGKKS